MRGSVSACRKREVLDLFLVCLLGGLHVLQPGDLVLLQPARLAREIGQIDQDADADQNRRQRLRE